MKVTKTVCAPCLEGKHAHAGKPYCQETRCRCTCRFDDLEAKFNALLQAGKRLLPHLPSGAPFGADRHSEHKQAAWAFAQALQQAEDAAPLKTSEAWRQEALYVDCPYCGYTHSLGEGVVMAEPLEMKCDGCSMSFSATPP